MLYAYILQLKNWVQWHICDINAWLNRINAWLNLHAAQHFPGREQATKDLRSFFQLSHQLNFMTEQ